MGNIKSFHFPCRMLKASVRFRSQRTLSPVRSEPQKRKTPSPFSTQEGDEEEVVYRCSFTSNFQPERWYRTIWNLIYSQSPPYRCFLCHTAHSPPSFCICPYYLCPMTEGRPFISTHSCQNQFSSSLPSVFFSFLNHFFLVLKIEQLLYFQENTPYFSVLFGTTLSADLNFPDNSIYSLALLENFIRPHCFDWSLTCEI